jgi:hypothetical protein
LVPVKSDQGDVLHEPPQTFIKFFGSNGMRADRSLSVVDEVKRSGNHMVCTYSKRPISVRDGAIIFMGRLVSDPNDIVIYGRAIGSKHDPSRDNATKDDVALRPWRSRWSHYIRIHDPQFIDATLGDGVPLSELMDTLTWQAFASTSRNFHLGKGNQDPRRALRQQAAVELSEQGAKWVEDRLNLAFEKFGVVEKAIIRGIQ